MKLLSKFIIAIAFIFLLSTPFYIPRLIRIKNISCESQFGKCDQKLSEELDEFSGQNLSIVKKRMKEYLENNFQVRDFSLQYKAFETLKVNILIKKSNYCLKSNDYEVFAYIDEFGNVLELREICNLPLINIFGKIPNVGESVGNELLNGLNLINQIFASYNIKEGHIVSDSLQVSFPKGYKVIFPLDQDIKILMGSLRLIINRLNSSESESRIIEDRINVIDLRYENPVLR
ncbi:hypothetical protein ACFL15_01265 [Patescibacteria group bacterium]